jgi:hypothetical protein
LLWETCTRSHLEINFPRTFTRNPSYAFLPKRYSKLGIYPPRRQARHHALDMNITTLRGQCPTLYIGHPFPDVMPDSVHPASLCSRHSRHWSSGVQLACVSDGSPLTTGGDDGEHPGRPDSVHRASIPSRHSRQSLSGVHLSVVSDESPVRKTGTTGSKGLGKDATVRWRFH